MRVFIDTNVIMDALLGRQPFFAASDKVIKYCHDKKINGFLAAHSVTNLFYMLRKFYKDEELRDIIKNLLDFLDIEQINKNKVLKALDNTNFKDFEDGLQYECAKLLEADYIITRDKKDFEKGSIPCLDPVTFLEMFFKEGDEQ